MPVPLGHRAIFQPVHVVPGAYSARAGAAWRVGCAVDGSTRNRAEVIERLFSTGVPHFKVGSGLTLTEADYVFVM